MTMDISMQLVEQQCSRYLTTFANCLDKFPETWHIDCERQKVKLAKCAESEPIIVKIKTECQQQFRDYERCMNSNPVHPEYCLEDYMAFNSCAEQHVGQKKATFQAPTISEQQNSQR
ncbi:coiled-coil-helix-coiled-coil-helix domain-containing protein 5-like [Pomacea canaliculata]|uniref:coiled-coil-helix-coiled-coil-helix domain-containing protein 5-like n=1 Tax=Pomacea canaliculata TaxID=400727 RepID=UPI000D73C0AF|nr:coiled-coil-helix-coiled-coil-helix domain-containing protein 5-like [Pomacea canaliculata]